MYPKIAIRKALRRFIQLIDRVVLCLFERAAAKSLASGKSSLFIAILESVTHEPAIVTENFDAERDKGDCMTADTRIAEVGFLDVSSDISL
jgi:hypothetical protein